MTDSNPISTYGREVDGPELLAAPKTPVGLLFKIFKRDHEGAPDLTADEEREWSAYVVDREDYERQRDTLGIVDLADVMENGTTDPEMLTESLVRSEHHLVFGPRESAKTWFVMNEVAAVLGQGENVVWVDKEMGRNNVADRLKTFGVDPDLVRGHLIYMEFPSLDCSADSRTAWVGLLEVEEPALVVFDAQTELLADAGLNENSGTDVEKWSQAYITPARRLAAATLMIDHTGHSEKDRSVGSRQKGAAAKIEYKVSKDEDFSRDKVGMFTVEVTKNTVSAPIPEKRAWKIGGKDDALVYERAETGKDPRAAQKRDKEKAADNAVLATLKKYEADLPVSQNQLVGLVPDHSEREIKAAAKRLAASEFSPVVAKPGERRSLQYSLLTADDDAS
jgi:hypothetical protein